jgi:3',5'-cyclic-AMP phosphodiesterase
MQSNLERNSPFMITFVHISDTHLSHDPDYGRQAERPPSYPGAAALIEAINHLPFPIDFVLHTGDVAYDPDAAAYPAARELFGRLRVPIYYTPGNHDDPLALQHVLLGTEAISPFCYTVTVKGLRLIVLDSTGPAAPPAGSITAAQLGWLEQTLLQTGDEAVIVAVHHNPLPVGIPWLDDYMGLTNGLELHQVLLKAGARMRGVFFGHIHQNVQVMRDGILYCSAASSWYSFHAWPGQDRTVVDPHYQPGFNVVTVTAETTFIRQWQLPRVV